MKEKLGVAVDVGTVQKLRTLAGGERKVGELVSALTKWLWQQRSILERSSLEDCRIWDPQATNEIEQIKQMSRRLAVVEDALRDKGIFNDRDGMK